MKYLISNYSNANGITEVRVYNAGIIDFDENRLECGEYLSDAKPTPSEDEIYIDFTL